MPLPADKMLWTNAEKKLWAQPTFIETHKDCWSFHNQWDAPADYVTIEIPSKYKQFESVFAKDEFDSLPPRRPWDHAIELIPDAKVADCKVYPLSRTEQTALDQFLDENLQSGRI